MWLDKLFDTNYVHDWRKYLKYIHTLGLYTKNLIISQNLQQAYTTKPIIINPYPLIAMAVKT